MKRFRQRKAFTIVEMVIVIAVIAILATVLVPTISGVIQKANHSADQQFVASLNVQLALWDVDHDILSESDLRDAINYYYGDWEDEAKTQLKADGDFYAKLSPKSAPQGYHYWWNATEKCVELMAVTKDDIPETALTADAELDFDTLNPRCFTFKSGNTYLLMDRAGDNALTNAVAKMDSMSDSADFGSLVALLQSDAESEVDTALYRMLLKNLQTVAVFNDGGIFTFNSEVSYFYIPQTAKSLSASAYVITDGVVAGGSITVADSLKAIIVPSSAKFLEGSAIFNRAVSSDNNPFLDGQVELHLNAEAAELGTHFDIGATDCVIVLPSGRYIQEGNGFKLLTASGATTVEGATSEYTVKVESFKVNPTNSNKVLIEDGKIYIAEDAGTVTLDIDDVIGKDQAGNTINDFNAGSVALTIGETKINGSNSVSFNVNQVTEGTKITVKIQEVSYSYTVMIDKAISIHSVLINGISKDGFAATGDNYAYNIDYKQNDVWTIVYKIEQNHKKTTVDAITITPDDLTILERVDNGLKVKAASGLKTVNVTLKSGDAERVCEITLIDATQLAFTVNSNVDTQGKYNLTFTLGTSGSMTLSELFTATNLNAVGDYVYINYKNGSSKVLKSNWANYDILSEDINDADTLEALFGKDAANGTTASLEISIGNSKDATNQKKLSITLVKGAKNVKSASDWKDASGNIVILNSFDIPAVDMVTSTPVYAKNIGANTIYGNLNRIGLSTYTIAQKANNYFIYMTTGTIKDLIIDGPEYSVVAGTQDASGYYVSGVEVAPGSGNKCTFSNCYISGFRSPIRVNNGECVLKNTTLYGGVVANMYVKGSGTKLTFENSVTIQRTNKHNLIGVGFYLDTDAKNVIVSGSLTQHNFVSYAEISGLTVNGASGADYADTLWGLDSGKLVHSIDSDNDYIHTGFWVKADSAFSAGSIKTFNLSNESNYRKKITIRAIITVGYVYSLDDTKCSNCANCKLTPDNELTIDSNNDGVFDQADTTYNYEDFLSARNPNKIK